MFAINVTDDFSKGLLKDGKEGLCHDIVLLFLRSRTGCPTARRHTRRGCGIWASSAVDSISVEVVAAPQ